MRYDHAHQSPGNMTIPLMILATLALGVAWEPAQALLFAGIAAVVWAAVYLLNVSNDNAATKRLLRSAIGGVLVIAIVGAIWSAKPLTLLNLLEQSRPVGTLPTTRSVVAELTWPSEPLSHAYATPITLLAFATAWLAFC